jgi:Spy/CpxP family protein refolding chaperone
MHAHMMGWWRAPRARPGLFQAHAGGGCGPHGGGPGGGWGFGGGGPEGGGYGVRRPLRYLIHKLELSEKKATQLAKIIDELKTERAQAEVDERRSTASFADAVSGESFDEAVAKAAAERRAETAQAWAVPWRRLRDPRSARSRATRDLRVPIRSGALASDVIDLIAPRPNFSQGYALVRRLQSAAACVRRARRLRSPFLLGPPCCSRVTRDGRHSAVEAQIVSPDRIQIAVAGPTGQLRRAGRGGKAMIRSTPAAIAPSCLTNDPERRRRAPVQLSTPGRTYPSEKTCSCSAVASPGCCGSPPVELYVNGEHVPATQRRRWCGTSRWCAASGTTDTKGRRIRRSATSSSGTMAISRCRRPTPRTCTPARSIT